MFPQLFKVLSGNSHDVLRGLEFVFLYLDDILIAFANEKEHEKHLNLVFESIHKYGLWINISKSVFAISEIEFLRYLIIPKAHVP